jgi:hypothetical protein
MGFYFVLSEAFDYLLENPWYHAGLALFSFYIGLEGRHTRTYVCFIIIVLRTF